MPLDPSIPLSGQPAQIPDPFAKLGDLLQLQQMKAALEDRQRKQQMEQQQAAEEQQLAGAVTQARRLPAADREAVLSGLPPQARLMAEKYLTEFDTHRETKRKASRKELATAARAIKDFGYDPSVAQFVFNEVGQDYPEATQLWSQIDGDRQKLKALVDQAIALDPDYKPDAEPSLIQRDPTKDLVHPKTGAVVQPGVPEPPKKTYQRVIVMVKGRPTFANFEPDTGKYFDLQGQELPNPQPEQPQGAQPSYQPKEVLNDAGKPVMANYDSRTGRYLDIETGKPIAHPRPVPSASETQDARKFKQASPILAAVTELSERINTLQGVVAKAQGEVERQKAKVNLNDDVAEYDALISGFTPLVARALGHTGVLTQQDVDSVKALFPRPGDSKSLRDRKVTRIKTIISELESDARAGAAPASPPAADKDGWTDLGNGVRIRTKKP